MSTLKYIVSRLKEPSTYAGFSGLALAFGLTADVYTAISAAVASIAGLIAVILYDGEKPID